MRWARRSTEEEELGAVVVYSFDPLRSEHGDGRIFGVDGKSSARFAYGQSVGVLICGAEKRIVGKQSRGTDTIGTHSNPDHSGQNSTPLFPADAASIFIGEQAAQRFPHLAPCAYVGPS